MKGFFFFLFLLFPIPVFGIGVSPPSYLLPWEPGFEGDFTYTVINTAGRPMVAAVTVEGNLAPYITSYDKEVDMPGGSGQFHFSIKMPQEVDLVGFQYAKFTITESNPETKGTGAKTAIEAKLRLEFPYPGIYATYFLSCPPVNVGDEVLGIANLRNLGKETIKDATLSFTFMQKDGTIIKSEKIEGITFAPGESLELKQKFETIGLPAGPYTMSGKFMYDKTINRQVNFSIGTHDVDILEHSENIEKLPISKFTVKVKSRWKGTISNLYGGLVVNGKEHKSPTVTLKDFEETTLEFFVAGDDLVQSGEKAKITVYFDGKTKEKELAYTLTEPKAEPEPEPETEKPMKRQLAIPLNTTTMLIILVIILVAINGYFLLRKKTSKEEAKNTPKEEEKKTITEKKKRK